MLMFMMSMLCAGVATDADAAAADAADATDDDAVAYAPFDAGAGVGAEC